MFTKIKNIIKYRELIKNLVIKDLKVRYKESLLGFFWSLLNPLLSLVIYSVVFGILWKSRFRGDVPFSLAFFSALLPWTFFVGALNDATVSIVGAGSLVKKIYFPREILPISKVLTNLVNFLLTFLVLFPVLFIFQIKGVLPPFGPEILFLPLIIFIQLIFLSGLALILSSLQVNYRDVEHTIQVFLLAWFFFTPIVYDPTVIILPRVSERIFFIYKAINPLTPLILSYRDILIYSKFPNFLFLSIAFAVSLAILYFGNYIFNRYEPYFAEDI